MTDVGVIGAGRMGQPIIGHLARKGFRTHVYDIDAGKRAAVEARGAQWAADLAALAAASDVMLVCVGYDEELRALFPQLASAARPGAIVAVLSTVHPKTMQDLASAYGTESSGAQMSTAMMSAPSDASRTACARP